MNKIIPSYDELNEKFLTRHADEVDWISVMRRIDLSEFSNEFYIRFKSEITTAHNIIKLDCTRYASAMLSILDYIKLMDNDLIKLKKEFDFEVMTDLNHETLSMMMFRKMKGYGVDLNKDLGFTHLKPVLLPK